ncbi:hypothetical protein NIES267_05490 [Calothrix parasitica NIES-267]|uniref:Uncharacterized protein n=1 Tax=Calothrix parasitica NIES-267 TaxID=1973488 RepID=A0A1Z4LIR9_9CYAN|nr:hypothetical protein NIES267_05490 [Calothrix parasitica NIES-267]
MNTSTTQILATLEVLLQEEIICRLRHNDISEWQPFYWESSVKGEFNFISLLYSQGWMRNTDIEIAIQNWQEIEEMGVPTPGGENFYAECVFEDEEDEVDRKSPQFQQRKNYYQQLSKFLKSNLYDLEVYEFSCWAEYSCFAIVGQILDNENWICVTSTVPKETPDFNNIIVTENNPEVFIAQAKSNLESQIDKILEFLTPVLTYGHYDGGYEQTYHHQIIYQTASNKQIALKNALIKSSFLQIGEFQTFYPDNGDYIFQDYSGEEEGEELYQKYQNLNSFLKTKFPKSILYTFRFWNYIQLFIVSESTENDPVGLRLSSEFDYNP